jgi:hypothetical protein
MAFTGTVHKMLAVAKLQTLCDWRVKCVLWSDPLQRNVRRSSQLRTCYQAVACNSGDSSGATPLQTQLSCPLSDFRLTHPHWLTAEWRLPTDR